MSTIEQYLTLLENRKPIPEYPNQDKINHAIVMVLQNVDIPLVVKIIRFLDADPTAIPPHTKEVIDAMIKSAPGALNEWGNTIHHISKAAEPLSPDASK